MQKIETILARLKSEHPIRRHPSEEEHQIQTACVRWFAYTHPELRGRLFAVPNGGRRDATTAGKLKAEGVVAGVSDLILLAKRGQYGALLIEMKTEKGRLSSSQTTWKKSVCSQDEYKYVVCRSLDDFMKEVDNYLNTVDND